MRLFRPWLILLLSAFHAAGQESQVARWQAANVRPERVQGARFIAARILANERRYKQVSETTRVPWHVIAGLHNMESGGSFRHHLHEGSPLSGRTRWIPKGRPASGSPPFTWEASAFDALFTLKRMDLVQWSSLESTLYACEKYNGLGYLKYHRSVPTPYLWAGTSIERPGKYVADGKWSSTARSSQTGIATIWKVMERDGKLSLPR